MAELIMQEESGTPSTPGSNKWKLYPQPSGFFSLDDAGSETPVWITGSSWTPTPTNWAVGNGTLTSKYTQSGKIVVFELQFVLGSTSTVGTSPHFTLPVTPMAVPKNTPIGQCRYLDASAATAWQGVVQLITSSLVCRLFALDSSTAHLTNATITSTVPFTWATSDEIEVSGYYIAA